MSVAYVLATSFDCVMLCINKCESNLSREGMRKCRSRAVKQTGAAGGGYLYLTWGGSADGSSKLSSVDGLPIHGGRWPCFGNWSGDDDSDSAWLRSKCWRRTLSVALMICIVSYLFQGGFVILRRFSIREFDHGMHDAEGIPGYI